MRKTKTSSGKTAIQVVFIGGHKTKILKHIGSGKTQKEIEDLVVLANHFIATQNSCKPLFPEYFSKESQNNDLVLIENLIFIKNLRSFAYEVIHKWFIKTGFNKLNNQFLQDLVIARILKPASKLKTLSILKHDFNIHHPKNRFYDELRRLYLLKQKVEKIAYSFAKIQFNCDFKLVFYDVTTLYFEAFKEDELRKCGFSKDNKQNQPQIVIGLLVNQLGYPIAYDVFKGNTFEGHTFIPIILRLKKSYKIKDLVVIADSAMLSLKNIEELEKHNLKYIVGARVSNLSFSFIEKMSKSLNQIEGNYFQAQTKRGRLIATFSKKRASKDKSNRKKQLARAARQLQNPSTISRKSKFLKIKDKQTYIFNEKLIYKSTLLEGIKGYYTNLNSKVKPSLIVKRYHDLWNVEKSFRIAKSDLFARPIFHYQEESIKSHILIVFVSLCVTKAIEIATQNSIAKVKELIWPIQDVQFKDKLSNKIYLKRMKIVENPTIKILLN